MFSWKQTPFPCHTQDLDETGELGNQQPTFPGGEILVTVLGTPERK